MFCMATFSTIEINIFRSANTVAQNISCDFMRDEIIKVSTVIFQFFLKIQKLYIIGVHQYLYRVPEARQTLAHVIIVIIQDLETYFVTLYT